MARRNLPNLSIENARLIFRNFSGTERGKYNRQGDRNFCVVIDNPQQVNDLRMDGWNVKERPPREDGGDPTYYLPVAVSFKNVPGIPPTKVIVIAGDSKMQYDENNIGELDFAELQNVDVVLRPYCWEREDTGEHGVKAYLSRMYATLYMDEFEAKYANVGKKNTDEQFPF